MKTEIGAGDAVMLQVRRVCRTEKRLLMEIECQANWKCVSFVQNTPPQNIGVDQDGKYE
jgi:hypothetical protein